MSDYETSDRGFKHYEGVATTYGHVVKVYESSAAMQPCLWLSVELTEEGARTVHSNIAPVRAAAHLTLEQAEQIRDNLDAAIRNHYQNE